MLETKVRLCYSISCI